EAIVFDGERLRGLLSALGNLEEALQILERRGFNIAQLFTRMRNGQLPRYRVLLGGTEHWFFTPAEVDAFKEHEQRQGHELVVADEAAGGNGQTNGHTEAFAVNDLHTGPVNAGLEKLRTFSLRPADLVPAPRVAGREPPPRFFLENGERK